MHDFIYVSKEHIKINIITSVLLMRTFILSTCYTTNKTNQDSNPSLTPKSLQFCLYSVSCQHYSEEQFVYDVLKR